MCIRDSCVVVNNEYSDDKHLPVERVSVLIVADNCDNDVIVTINTNGDWTNNTNVVMIFDKIIMGGVTLCLIIMVQWKKQMFMVTTQITL